MAPTIDTPVRLTASSLKTSKCCAMPLGPVQFAALEYACNVNSTPLLNVALTLGATWTFPGGVAVPAAALIGVVVLMPPKAEIAPAMPVEDEEVENLKLAAATSVAVATL